MTGRLGQCVFLALLVAGSVGDVAAQTGVDDFNPGVSSEPEVIVVQPDGRILVGGHFYTLAAADRNKVGRLNSDGSIDTSFVNPRIDCREEFSATCKGSIVEAIALQPDGRVLVGGHFDIVGEASRLNIARLRTDGTLDAAFNPGATNLPSLPDSSDPAGIVYAIAVQPDGKILVGGVFNRLGGADRANIGRLNPDGSVDLSFNSSTNGQVDFIIVQPDGKILLGGYFTTLAGVTRYGVGRLYPDGTIDIGFDPGVNDRVRTAALQPDGKIVLGGEFTSMGFGGLGSLPRHYIGRVHANGQPDLSFDPGADDWVRDLALQGNNQILVGGDFTMLGGGGTGATRRNYMGRLNPDGSLDASFEPDPSNTVETIAVQGDRRILLGGHFNWLRNDTIPRDGIARVFESGTALSVGASGR